MPKTAWIIAWRPPISSENDSTTIPWSSGTPSRTSPAFTSQARIAAAARASSPQAVAAHDSKSGASAFSAASRRRRPTASPSSHERDGCSPFQNGIVGDMPCASSTSTRSARTLTIFHAWEPSRNTSPGRLSVTNSSSSVPTLRSVSATKTSKRPLSGMVPPDVSARNRLPRRACSRSLTRSHRIRGAAPLTSAGSGSASERTTARRSSRERLRYGAAFWKRAWSASTVKDSAATAATTCWASTSSGASGITTRSSWRPRMDRTTAAASRSSSPLVTMIRPLEVRLSR